MPFRSDTAERAVGTAVAEIDRLGLEARVEHLGPVWSPTLRVELVRAGAAVAVGCGKGLGAAGVASAYFEALERYLMSARDNLRWTPEATALWSATAVAAQPALAPDLVVQRWAAEFPGAVAACAAYQGLAGTVRYPTFLVDPRYYRWPVDGDSVDGYRGVLRYSSSLGTAAGLTVDEAAYHGLCELVEHDGLGQALLRWFVAGDPGVDEVAPASLPEDLRALHADAVRAAGAPVHLLDVTTDLGVPVYLAVSALDGRTRMGAGSSVWATDAAGRALAELIQMSVPEAAGAEASAVRRLASWPALQRCARLPVADLLAGPVRTVPLRADVDGDGSPRWGLDRLRRGLAANGVDFHVCPIAPAGSLVAVATVIAPGLERFSLVRHGVPVIPTGRGWHLWPSPEPVAA